MESSKRVYNQELGWCVDKAKELGLDLSLVGKRVLHKGEQHLFIGPSGIDEAPVELWNGEGSKVLIDMEGYYALMLAVVVAEDRHGLYSTTTLKKGGKRGDKNSHPKATRKKKSV